MPDVLPPSTAFHLHHRHFISLPRSGLRRFGWSSDWCQAWRVCLTRVRGLSLASIHIAVGTPPCRSLECQAKYSAQGKARPPFCAQKPWSGPMEKLRSVYVFLLSPNRQHERTVGHLEVSRTKNQITRLAFQVFKTTMFRKIPPGGFPGRKNKNNSTSVTQRRPHQQKM